MIMRRLLLVDALTACASGQQSSESSDLVGSRPVILTSDRILEGDRPRSSVATIDVPPAIAWPIVKRVYRAMEIDVTTDNAVTHQVGNQNFWKTRRLAGRPMSDFVDCGTGMTGRKADTYRIFMSVLTLVNPDGKGGTKLETLFVPVGQDVAGGSTDRVSCGSTGALEMMINESVRATLGK
jgi:hypothetical protein